jgi:hypothetical protein
MHITALGRSGVDDESLHTQPGVLRRQVLLRQPVARTLSLLRDHIRGLLGSRLYGDA